MHLQQLMGFTLLVVIMSFTAAVSVTSPTLSGIDPASESEFALPRTHSDGHFSDGGERTGLSDKLANLFSSSKVTPERLQQWLDGGKSADFVFGRMRLKQAGEWLLHRLQFTEWLKYVDDLSAKGTPASAISTLTNHYGDATLYSMIQSAKRYPTTKDVTARLQKEQMQHWVNTAKTPDEVFLFMKLDKVKDNMLNNPEFIAWSKYVDDLSAKYPDTPASMVPALVKHYKSDSTLFKIADTSKSVEGIKDIATKLEDQLIRFWLSGRKSPEDVLVKLDLDATGYSLLDEPLFSSWLKYTNAYSVRFPEEKSSAIETLTRRFGDEKLGKIIGEAKTKEPTRAFAVDLEAAQLGMWWKNGKSVEDVLHLQRLGVIQDFTHNPLLHTWVSYMNMYATKNPDVAAAMLRKMETWFQGRPLNQILLEAMKFQSMKKVATALQKRMIESYAVKNEPPTRVFRWLNLDNVGDNLLTDRLFLTWLKYAKDFNNKNPKQREYMFEPIGMSYSNGEVKRMIDVAMRNPSATHIVKLIVKQRSRYWLDKKNLPQYVFRFLGLEVAGENTLSSSNFKLWAKYLSDFNRRYPDEKTTMIDGIQANYHDFDIVKMLNTAKQDTRTKKLALNLESALVNKWVANKETIEGLKGLKRRFSHMRVADNLIADFAAKVNALAGKTS